MTRIVNTDDVEKMRTTEVRLEAVKQSFQGPGREIAVTQLRTHTYVSLESSRQSYRLKTMNGEANGRRKGSPRRCNDGTQWFRA